MCSTYIASYTVTGAYTIQMLVDHVIDESFFKGLSCSSHVRLSYAVAFEQQTRPGLTKPIVYLSLGISSNSLPGIPSFGGFKYCIDYIVYWLVGGRVDLQRRR